MTEQQEIEQYTKEVLQRDLLLVKLEIAGWHLDFPFETITGSWICKAKRGDIVVSGKSHSRGGSIDAVVSFLLERKDN